MIAELYIKDKTFICDATDIKSLRCKLLSFSDMVRFATSGERKNDNVFYLDKSKFRDTIVFGDCTVNDFLCCSQSVIKVVGPDVINALCECMKIFKSLPSESDDKIYPNPDNQEAKSNKDKVKYNKKKADPLGLGLPEPTKDRACAVCVLNHTVEFPENLQVISTKKELGAFRRRHFIRFENHKEYFDEVKKYMEWLVLHPSIREDGGFGKVFSSHKKQIDKCLTGLAEYDYVAGFRSFKGNSTDYPGVFVRETHICDDASFQGGDMKRYALNFEGRSNKVSIEPHLKMYSDDRGKRPRNCRIYFEQPNHNESKLYIGYICEHL